MSNLIKHLDDVQWNERTWLNDNQSGFTGSIVTYAGFGRCDNVEQTKFLNFFIEIADCQTKIRLHNRFAQEDDDILKEIIKFERKVQLMRQELQAYEDHISTLKIRAKN